METVRQLLQAPQSDGVRSKFSMVIRSKIGAKILPELFMETSAAARL